MKWWILCKNADAVLRHCLERSRSFWCRRGTIFRRSGHMSNLAYDSYVKFGTPMDMDPLLQPECTHHFSQENNYFNQKFYHFTFLFKKLEILNGNVLGTLVVLFQLWSKKDSFFFCYIVMQWIVAPHKRAIAPSDAGEILLNWNWN